VGLFDEDLYYDAEASWFDEDAPTAAPSTSPATIFGSDLAHWWYASWDSGTGTFTDSVGGADAVQATGSKKPTAGTTDAANLALVFDGTDDAIIAGDITTLDGLQDLTFWGGFKGGASQNAFATVIGKLFSSVAFHMGAANSPTNFIAEVGSLASGNGAVSDGNPFDDTWRHFIFTYGTGGTGTLYIGGVAQAQGQIIGPVFPDVTEELTIGAVSSGGTTDYHFTGSISNVGIATTTATSGQVADLAAYLDAWLGIGAGGLSNISGSTTGFAFSPAATIRATVAASGSTTGFAFTPAATIKATAAASGSTTGFAFTPSATVAATSAIAGSIAGFAFTPAGTVGASMAAAGSVSGFAFTPAATIQASADVSGAVAGFAFSPAATVQATASVAGSSSWAFAPTAEVSAFAALSGSSSFAFTLEGTLEDGGAVVPVVVASHDVAVYVPTAVTASVHVPAAASTIIYVPAAEAVTVHVPESQATEVVSIEAAASEVRAA